MEKAETTPARCTGKRDKHGTEIKEGDILQIGQMKYVVEWDGERFVTRNRNGLGSFLLEGHRLTKSVVVGKKE